MPDLAKKRLFRVTFQPHNDPLFFYKKLRVGPISFSEVRQIEVFNPIILYSLPEARN